MGSEGIGQCSQAVIFERLTDSEPMYLPATSKMRPFGTISHPKQVERTAEAAFREIEGEMDYCYRQHCKYHCQDEYEEPLLDSWVAISDVLPMNSRETKVTELSQLLEVLRCSEYFELSEDQLRMRGTPLFVQINNPMSEDEDEEYI